MPLYVRSRDRDPLQDPLMFLAGGALIPICKVALLETFWGGLATIPPHLQIGANTYFEFFEIQCRLALNNWEKYDLSELKFSHITKVTKMFMAGSTRQEIESHLGEFLLGDCRIIASEIIDLTVRLVLMVPVWNFWQGVCPEESALTWVEGTVKRSFERHFRPKSKQSPGSETEFSVKQSMILDKSFTAQRIEELGGMKIIWTNNLLDHLKMKPKDNQVYVYHYASHIYPAGLVEETLKTLALLLPRADKDTKDWFAQQKFKHHLDPEAASCRTVSREERNIEKFL
ncbi:hypothetical protein BGHDH14_bgh05782 [Blumeria hordei DH14]|uniref:Uncharacterized protein n=1 Tax=Blumeria graminis f. sp. hordei (strain DH14) TaxID=546991 RepID=N1J9D8_BLUG1|nr:hypothetical protein BGHDH14_bgh05782 [Blumeria hordei DH14]